MTTVALVVVCVTVLTVTAALLAAAETGMTRLGRVKAQALAEEGRPGAAQAVVLMTDPARTLLPAGLVRLVCQLGAAGVVGVVVADRTKGVLVPLAVLAAMAMFEYMASEAVPRGWAIRHPQRAALASAPAVAVLGRLPPLRAAASAGAALARWVGGGGPVDEPIVVSEEELRAIADVAAEEEVLEFAERRLIHSIISFGDTVAREVMVPRPDMVTASCRESAADVMELAIARGYSRIPVVGDDIDDLRGVAFAKDLMRVARDGEADRAVGDVARPVHFVPETKRVTELLREMQSEQFHLAVVVDEYGGTAGLVTLEDLIEELVGEIVDEFDVEDPLVEPLPGGDLRVDARLALDECNELLQAGLPQGDWDTVGGLVLGLLGHVPQEGEEVTADSHRLRAEKVVGRRIGKVRIMPLRPEDVGV